MILLSVFGQLQQIIASSYDVTSHFVQVPLFVSFHASKSSTVDKCDEANVWISWILFYKVGSLLRILINTFSFWWMHVLHQLCRQQTKREKLECCTSTWAQPRWLRTVQLLWSGRSNQKSLSKALSFKEWDRDWKEPPKHVNLLCVPTLQPAAKRLCFSAGLCSSTLVKSSCKLFGQQVAKQLDWKCGSPG